MSSLSMAVPEIVPERGIVVMPDHVSIRRKNGMTVQVCVRITSRCTARSCAARAMCV